MGTKAAGRAVYECPHCREELESSTGPWSGWRLCARCGRAGLPPKRWPGPDGKRDGKARHAAPAHGVFVTSGPANRAPGSTIHLWFVGSVLVLASTLSYIAFLDQIRLSVVLEGVAALALSGLLLYVGKRRKK